MRRQNLAMLWVGVTVSALVLTGCGKHRQAESPETGAGEMLPAAATENYSEASATQLNRYHAVKGSKVRIDGTSTVHDWQAEGSLIGGWLDFGAGFPDSSNVLTQPGPLTARAEAFIPVRSLKSIEKDGKPYSDTMDDVMQEKLLLTAHPRINYRLVQLTLRQGAQAAAESSLCDATGDLVVAGITNRLSFPVQLFFLGDDHLKIAGRTSVKMTDFGIQPPSPKLLLGLIKTGNEVQLSFEWMLAKPPAG